MRQYYESLKDRQLSLAFLAYCVRNYSSTIITHEVSALRDPSTVAQLKDEGLNVRIASGGGATVAGGGSAEVVASYLVDEQPMEIGIRLPAEFPLRGVEIRDLKRVGVPENKWRGWLMGIQQTITSRVRRIGWVSIADAIERSDPGSAHCLQKECCTSFRRRGRVRDLLLVGEGFIQEIKAYAAASSPSQTGPCQPSHAGRARTDSTHRVCSNGSTRVIRRVVLFVEACFEFTQAIHRTIML